MLLREFPELNRRYWDNHFWGIGYGSWSTGNITEELLSSYLDHHKDHPNSNENFFLESTVFQRTYFSIFHFQSTLVETQTYEFPIHRGSVLIFNFQFPI